MQKILQQSMQGREVWERLLEGIELSDDGCWLWSKALRPEGYGTVRIKGVNHNAHRASYLTFVGPIAEGLHVDHLCRVRACINPAHLEAVTVRENILRGHTVAARNASKTHCPAGHAYDSENTAYDKKGGRSCKTCQNARHRAYYDGLRRAAGAKKMLKAEDVLEIRNLYHSGISRRELAERFDCTESNITYIVTGKSWPKVGGLSD